MPSSDSNKFNRGLDFSPSTRIRSGHPVAGVVLPLQEERSSNHSTRLQGGPLGQIVGWVDLDFGSLPGL